MFEICKIYYQNDFVLSCAAQKSLHYWLVKYHYDDDHMSPTPNHSHPNCSFPKAVNGQ